MKRRSFLAALFAAPMVPAVAKAAELSAGPYAEGKIKHVVSQDLPMVFEDGILKIKSANVGQVTAGIIRKRDGKMVVDLTNGVITLKG